MRRRAPRATRRRVAPTGGGETGHPERRHAWRRTSLHSRRHTWGHPRGSSHARHARRPPRGRLGTHCERVGETAWRHAWHARHHAWLWRHPWHHPRHAALQPLGKNIINDALCLFAYELPEVFPYIVAVLSARIVLLAHGGRIMCQERIAVVAHEHFGLWG